MTQRTHWPGNLNFRLPCETRPSSLPGAGTGAFALAAAREGDFLGIDTPQSSWLVSAEEALNLPDDVRPYTWRHVEHICFVGGRGEPTATAFLNHSFEPNVLWHVGCYFARRDIAPGDELFLDYSALIDPLWGGRITDSAGGKKLEGVEWRRALLDTCRSLTEVLEASLARDEGPEDGNP
jgi:hypothetical protein